MPRNVVSSPLLEPGVSSRRNKRRSFIVLAVLGAVVLIGLLLIGGRPRLTKPISAEQGGSDTGKATFTESHMTDYQTFLVKDDFRGEKLSKQQLGSLVGMYYTSKPQYAELKALFEAGTKVPWFGDIGSSSFYFLR